MYSYDKIADHLFSYYEADDGETILNFFITFSRMEYALKRAGLVKGDNKSVSADWDKFATELQPWFISSKTEVLQEAVTYFLNNPPNKQVLQSGQVAWVSSTGSSNDPLLKTLLIFVRRARNNLFHGEKIKGLLEGQPERNLMLMRYGLTILYECLNLCSNAPSCVDIPNYFLGEMKWELRK